MVLFLGVAQLTNFGVITVASAALFGDLVAAPAVMQAGFAMLEAGSVGDSAVTNILFKASGNALVLPKRVNLHFV
jgi:hypothetical protein